MSRPLIKAIVTGHTQGLGGALAAGLMLRQIPVLGLARGAAAALATRFGPLLSEHRIDLADSAALAAYLAGDAWRAHLDGSTLILLINNAGMVEPVGALHDQDPLAVAQAVALNVAAPLMLAAAVAAARGAERRILHVSSGAAHTAYPGWSVYGATKAALDHHARAVALDHPAGATGPGVRICSLAPGVIDTDMQARIRATPASRFPSRERFVALQRDGGLSSPEQCAAGVIAYLLDERFGRVPVDDLRTSGR